jgi:hypothetical protein
VTIKGEPNNSIISSENYTWSQSVTQPADSEFSETVPSTLIELDGKTGNNWYIWVKVEYDDDGIEKVGYFRSEPFFVDNTPPTFSLETDDISTP